MKKSIAKYPYGIFDWKNMIGYHINHGYIDKVIKQDINGGIYERYFFEKDLTHGQGIDKLNIEAWLYRP